MAWGRACADRLTPKMAAAPSEAKAPEDGADLAFARVGSVRLNGSGARLKWISTSFTLLPSRASLV
jgi:hypothetical protein